MLLHDLVVAEGFAPFLMNDDIFLMETGMDREIFYSAVCAFSARASAIRKAAFAQLSGQIGEGMG